ncbi:substrate-binding domain-containing protein [Streptomyces sp. S.PB5]|uniref:substrate-binding domain-containing protein n=1 Tax=Streptomyces sp. S.PB5 TaxID=3020844 RepID=UPI0025B0A310|nr:substrate-binding domain-containing protein [Streptomyces sp. S.PB5]
MIFTALRVEYEKVTAHLLHAKAQHVDTVQVGRGVSAAVYEVGGRVRWRVYLSRTGTGNTATAAAVSNCLSTIQPDAAFFVGIAAGRKDAGPRDVVVAQRVYAYQHGKRSEKGFHARPDGWKPPRDIVHAAEQAANELGPLITYNIHFKPIASGDVVIDSLNAPDHEIIATSYEDTAAIETEGVGFASAVEEHEGLRWLLIRGISDRADGRKKVLEADAQEQAALNAAQVAVRTLLVLDIESAARPAAVTHPTLPLGVTIGKKAAKKTVRPKPPAAPIAKKPPASPPGPKSARPGALQGKRSLAVTAIALTTAVALVVSLQSCGNDGTGDEGNQTLSVAPSATLATCGDPDDYLYIASSVDKSRSLREAAAKYGNRSSGDTCVEIRVEDGNSGEAMRALARGWDEDDGETPDVWAPAGSSWLSLARANATAKTKALFPRRAESIVTSPLTVAMPKPMAEVLEWPENQFTWGELADWSTNAEGFWGAKNRGKPEWGDFKLGKTNPAYSTSGLNATLGAFYANTGTSGELTKARLDDPGNRNFVKSIEQSTVHYGDTTLTFLANLRRADKDSAQNAMSYISAVTLEESSVAAYNAGYPCGALSDEKDCAKTRKPETPLVSFYPTDGTLYSDHPYINLAPEGSAKRTVANDFLTYLHQPETFDQYFAPYGFRTHDGEITKGSPLFDPASGARPETPLDPLTLPRDDVLKHLLDIWPSLRRRANVLLLIDTSGSMNEEIASTGDSKLGQLKQAEDELLGEFTRSDRVGLWKFSDAEDLGGETDYRELVPLGPYDEKRLSENFSALEAEGATGLNDSLDAALTSMRADYDPKAINAIILLTDGRNEDQGSLSEETLLRHIRDTSRPEVRIFTIAYGNKADEEDQKGRTALESIADAAGAQMYDAKKAEIIEQVITSVISNF